MPITHISGSGGLSFGLVHRGKRPSRVEWKGTQSSIKAPKEAHLGGESFNKVGEISENGPCSARLLGDIGE